MLDPALRRPPLAGLDLRTAWADVTLSDPGPAARLILRGDDAVAKQAGSALGLTIPLEACRSARRDGLAALWLGPDEWLVMAEAEANDLAQRIERALASLPHALVDVSARNAGLEVSGPGAAAVLNAGCPLDLASSAFPLGACTRTLLAKVENVLWRIGADAFRLEVARSLAAYVVLFLQEAARGERGIAGLGRTEPQADRMAGVKPARALGVR